MTAHCEFEMGLKLVNRKAMSSENFRSEQSLYSDWLELVSLATGSLQSKYFISLKSSNSTLKFAYDID